MQPFPHHYVVNAAATETGEVRLEAANLPDLASAPPAEFGGPGTRWSPETLLVAAVADCFVLTFRATAKLANLSWSSLSCDAVGTLDRIDRVTRFSEFRLRVRLQVPEGSSQAHAERVIDDVERNCLVSNSLTAKVQVERTVVVKRTAA